MDFKMFLLGLLVVLSMGTYYVYVVIPADEWKKEIAYCMDDRSHGLAWSEPEVGKAVYVECINDHPYYTQGPAPPTERL